MICEAHPTGVHHHTEGTGLDWIERFLRYHYVSLKLGQRNVIQTYH